MICGGADPGMAMGLVIFRLLKLDDRSLRMGADVDSSDVGDARPSDAVGRAPKVSMSSSSSVSLIDRSADDFDRSELIKAWSACGGVWIFWTSTFSSSSVDACISSRRCKRWSMFRKLFAWWVPLRFSVSTRVNICDTLEENAIYRDNSTNRHSTCLT